MAELNEELLKKRTAAGSLKTNPARAGRCSGSRTESIYRTEFMRDRDRVLYCKAFRRLAGKTQVFISGVDDHKRTRLTHTLEVSQIARAVAEPLRLDVDLVEAIALAHDLGHTPYGHAGERTLHEIMTPQQDHILGRHCPLEAANMMDAYRPFLGFKHNLQSLVVAMKLEQNHEEYGLDLTDYALYGIQGHSGGKYKPGRVCNHDMLGYYDAYLNKGCKTADGQWAWSLEALLVAEADEIAQWHHDVEDALFGGLITREEVVKIITECFGDYLPYKKLSKQDKEILKSPSDHDMGKFVSLISRILIDMLVTRLTVTATYHINALADKRTDKHMSFSQFRHLLDPAKEDLDMVFSYSYTRQEREDPDGFAKRGKKFAGTIGQRVLSSYDIQKADAKGRYIIRKLFQAYYATPQQLPDHCVYELLSEYHSMSQADHPQLGFRSQFQKYSEAELREMAKNKGVGSVRGIFSDLFADRSKTMPVEELLLMRVICNHIACMTDSYAQKSYQELYG